MTAALRYLAPQTPTPSVFSATSYCFGLSETRLAVRLGSSSFCDAERLKYAPLLRISAHGATLGLDMKTRRTGRMTTGRKPETGTDGPTICRSLLCR